MKRGIDQFADLYPSGFDYLLTAVAGVVTAYSVGRAVSNITIGYIFIVLLLLGLWVSFSFVRALRGGKLIRYNGFLYTGFVLISFLSSSALCDMLPENPFKAQIAICGALCWMLIFGSFLIWTDQTLLFQAVPCIAIFGLVGCYDTYRGATWMFFAFLLCFATLLARVHGRSMLRQAKESGYSQTGDRMDRSATELQRMRSGPWRSAAGPQWALASAGVVILFSFISAPIIRQTVQGVAANVIIQAPATPASRASAMSAADASATRIGRGPNDAPAVPVLRVLMDTPRYLRTNIYQVYSIYGWTSTMAGPVGDDANMVLGRAMERRALAAISKPKEISFEVEPLSSRVPVLPVPGEITSINPSGGVSIRLDATVAITRPGTGSFRGTAVVADPSVQPVNAWKDAPNIETMMDPRGVPGRVIQLARNVTAGKNTDYEKAIAIQDEIEKRAKYNLKAEATPDGQDAVEYFLFESKEGYCDLFASSMVLMARAANLPARYVVGYYPITGTKDESGRYIITAAERHAWAEIFFKEAGWVVFDATEGAVPVIGGERGTPNALGISSEVILQTTVDILIGVGLVSILVLSVRALVLTRSKGPSRTDLDREYLRFAGIVRHATGRARRFDQTPAEYVAENESLLNGAGAVAGEITRKFERMFYSPEPTSREQVKSLREEIVAFRALVRQKR